MRHLLVVGDAVPLVLLLPADERRRRCHELVPLARRKTSYRQQRAMLVLKR